MKRLILVFLLASELVAGSVRAQEGSFEGLRVRVVTAADSTFIGSLGEVSGESLLLMAEGEETWRVVSRDDIAAIDRSLGMKRPFGRGFLIGFLGTAGVVGVLSAVTWEPCTETGFMSCFMVPESRGGALGIGLLAGAMLGLPVGLITGFALPKREMWEPLTLPGSSAVDLSVRPAARFDRGASVGVTVKARF